jgi:hypothetical protein
LNLLPLITIRSFYSLQPVHQSKPFIVHPIDFSTNSKPPSRGVN